MKAPIGVAVALSLATAAQAQKTQTLPQNLPAIVKEAIEKNNKECEPGETLLFLKGFLTIRDINADGKPDYILNYDNFQCSERVSIFCGTGGCLTEIFASEEDKGLRSGLEQARAQGQLPHARQAPRHADRSAWQPVRARGRRSLRNDAVLERLGIPPRQLGGRPLTCDASRTACGSQ